LLTNARGAAGVGEQGFEPLLGVGRPRGERARLGEERARRGALATRPEPGDTVHQHPGIAVGRTADHGKARGRVRSIGLERDPRLIDEAASCRSQRQHPLRALNVATGEQRFEAVVMILRGEHSAEQAQQALLVGAWQRAAGPGLLGGCPRFEDVSFGKQCERMPRVADIRRRRQQPEEGGDLARAGHVGVDRPFGRFAHGRLARPAAIAGEEG
jgi:hypothetical protein